MWKDRGGVGVKVRAKAQAPSIDPGEAAAKMGSMTMVYANLVQR